MEAAIHRYFLQLSGTVICMSQLYVVIKLKENAVLATVQTGLRNAGFDQRVIGESEEEPDTFQLEGTIDRDLASNLITVPYVESVRTLREYE